MDKIVFKDLIINDISKSCFIADEEIKLTKNEYIILKTFLENLNKIFSRRELLNILGNTNVSLKSIDSTISRLRKKLGKLNIYLATKLGFGYGIIIE